MELTYSGKMELIQNLLGWAQEEPNGLAAKIFESAEISDSVASFLGLVQIPPVGGLRIAVRTKRNHPYDAAPGRGIGCQWHVLEFSRGMNMKEVQDQISRLVGAEGSATNWEVA